MGMLSPHSPSCSSSHSKRRVASSGPRSVRDDSDVDSEGEVDDFDIAFAQCTDVEEFFSSRAHGDGGAIHSTMKVSTSSDIWSGASLKPNAGVEAIQA